MTAWPGWTSDMISGLGIPDTGDNKNFLDEWAASDTLPCKNNPLGASHKRKGSVNCQRLNSLNTAQTYATRQTGIGGTKAQLSGGGYVHLWAALESGHPLAYTPATGLTLDLQKWGADPFYKYVEKQTGAGSAAFGAPNYSSVMGAWSHWMHVLSHKGPGAHKRISHAAARARRIAR